MPKVFYGLLSLIVFASCSPYEKILKSNDVNYKLTKANEYFDNKVYLKANEIYRSLLPVIKGTKNYEPLYYRYAYSFYYMKDYLSASYHFKNFTDFFPTSKDADECEYMHSLCLYKLSPKYSLDQTNTLKAMEAMQSYINTHPKSERISDANLYIDKGREKLEDKEADAAKLYFNISQFKAASITYREIIKDFPESPHNDFYQFMVLKSLYNFATQSIEIRQQERYEDVRTAFSELQSSYPKSTYIDEARKYTTLADDFLKKHNTITSK